MSDTILFYLLLIIFYLATCTVVTGRQTVLFTSRLLRRWHIGNESGLIMVRRGLLRGLNPLTPWQLSLMSEYEPVIYGKTGIVHSETQHYIPFTHHSSLNRQGPVIMYGKHVFAEFRNEQSAISSWRFIRKLAKLSPEERENAIAQHHKALAKTTGLMPKLALIASATAPLRWAGILMGLYMYITAPILYLRNPEPITLLTIFAVILGFHWFVICPLFVVTHRKIWKRRTEERWIKFAQLLLYPPAGLRLGEEIALPLGMSRVPWVWACKLLSGQEKLDFLSRTWRELSYPVIKKATDSTTTAIVLNHSQRQLVIFEEALQRQGYIEGIIKQPETKERIHNASLYCPRCLELYLGNKKTCEDCPGIELLPYSTLNRITQNNH